jgi:hypothetical protein
LSWYEVFFCAKTVEIKTIVKNKMDSTVLFIVKLYFCQLKK